MGDLRDQSCRGRVWLPTSGISGEGPTPSQVVRDKSHAMNTDPEREWVPGYSVWWDTYA